MVGGFQVQEGEHVDLGQRFETMNEVGEPDAKGVMESVRLEWGVATRELGRMETPVFSTSRIKAG